MANAKGKIYNDNSITKLEGPDRVRKRPAVIFGTAGLEGCEHSVFEILSNSVDEARSGYGNYIRVTMFRDHSIEIDDRGRGVPLGYNEKEKEWNWHLVFCELYAGGKYNNNSTDANYKYPLGTNGLGACATQYASEYMRVRSYDGTTVREMNFKKGFPVGELTERALERKEKRTGTVIRWKPDLEVFTDINIPTEYFSDMLHRQSVVNAGLEFVLAVEGEDGKFTEQSFLYENGIIDYVKELAGERAMTLPVFFTTEARGRDREDMPDYNVLAQISFCLTNGLTGIEYFHNSSPLEHGGATEKAARNAFVSALDKVIKNAGKYKKDEAKITYGDIEESLVLVINSFSTEASYENQTKKAVNNPFIQKCVTEFLTKQLEIYFLENPNDTELFIKNVLVNKRSREESEKSRLDLKKTLSKKSDDAASRVEKFVSCRSRDKNMRELYIVEGDSAMSSCKLGRNAEYQAIIPVRGKTLNCLKSGYDKILKNDIIVDLLRVIGCGAEIKSKHKDAAGAFRPEDLSWNKIIICTDADEDGFQIRTLLLTMFYRLLPTLIKEGRIYIAESPLFEITCKGKIYFAYTDAEKEEIIKTFGKEKYTVQRSKGLGENEPDMMWQTTMNPATRRLVAVTPADERETEEMFELLLGDNLSGRKEYIAEYGKLYLKDADI
ncbi:MAG: DNA topoisomerase [Clostridia bacterium]|nr:DNA topoisomerase [Clostridia bacterium]